MKKKSHEHLLIWSGACEIFFGEQKERFLINHRLDQKLKKGFFTLQERRFVTSHEEETLILDSVDQFLERDVRPYVRQLEADDESLHLS